MTHSLYSADRATHLKIVIVALVASIGVAGLGVSARVNAGDEYSNAERIIKADNPGFQAEGLPSCCLPGGSLCST
jgi:hypothetical protein